MQGCRRHTRGLAFFAGGEPDPRPADIVIRVLSTPRQGSLNATFCIHTQTMNISRSIVRGVYL